MKCDRRSFFGFLAGLPAAVKAVQAAPSPAKMGVAYFPAKTISKEQIQAGTINCRKLMPKMATISTVERDLVAAALRDLGVILSYELPCATDVEHWVRKLRLIALASPVAVDQLTPSGLATHHLYLRAQLAADMVPSYGFGREHLDHFEREALHYRNLLLPCTVQLVPSVFSM